MRGEIQEAGEGGRGLRMVIYQVKRREKIERKKNKIKKRSKDLERDSSSSYRPSTYSEL